MRPRRRTPFSGTRGAFWYDGAAICVHPLTSRTVAHEIPPSIPIPATATPTNRDAHRGRLFRKYLLLILTLITAALLASGAISIYFSYQEIKAALSNLQHEKALAAASRIEQYIHQIEQQLAYAALPQLDASDVELRRIEFLKLLRQAPEVTDIASSTRTDSSRFPSRASAWTTPNPARIARRSRRFALPKRGKPYFGPVYFRKETEPYMTIAIRSGSDTGPVTVADVNLKFIWDVVSRIKIGDKGKAYVVDRNGFLIADPDIGLVLRKTDLSILPHVKASNEGQGDTEAMLSTDLVRHGRPDLGGDHRAASLERVRRAAGPGGVREAVRVDPAHRALAARRPRDFRTGRAGARTRHGAARSASSTKARGASATEIWTRRSNPHRATNWKGSPTSSIA